MRNRICIVNRSDSDLQPEQVGRQLLIECDKQGLEVEGNKAGDLFSIETNEPANSAGDQHTYGIVIADASILSDRFSTMRAETLWDLPFRVIAIIIPERIDHFGYRFTSLQFSPMCLVHLLSRHRDLTGVVSYLINQFGR